MLGLNVTLVGLTVVFLALIVLAFIISIFSKVFSPSKKNDEISEEIITSAESQEQETVEVQNNTSDEELVAVLTAAVMASMSTGPDCKIRVKSFRRIPQNAPVWNIYGRKEYLYEKL